MNIEQEEYEIVSFTLTGARGKGDTESVGLAKMNALGKAGWTIASSSMVLSSVGAFFVSYTLKRTIQDAL